MDDMTGKSRDFGCITSQSTQVDEDAIAGAPNTIESMQIDPKVAEARPGAKKVGFLQEGNILSPAYCRFLPRSKLN